MIGNFPSPYPDELLYSICARFGDRMQYPGKKSVVRDLFDTVNVMAVVDLPSHLDSLIAALPPGCSCTADSLIDDHTLLPFYGPFLPVERLELIRRDMHGHRGTAISTRIGTVASRIPLPRWLRFCPNCVEEDRRNFGECYWHRVHQVPNVLVCPAHDNALQNSDAPARYARTKYEFIPAEYVVRAAPIQQPSLSHAYSDILLRIAQDAAWLLKQRELHYGPAILQKKYIAAFADHGLLTPSGKVRVDDLIRAFKGYYSPNLLNTLHCTVEERMIDSWFTRLFRPPGESQGSQHPVHHLLLIQFLGYELSTFFNIPVERKPFGEGPWPCLNPACDHYQKLTISECALAYDRKAAGSVIGTFSCYCGFVYTRKGPDTTGESQYQISRVKSRGDTWTATLQQLWEDPTVTLVQAAALLGTDRNTLKKYATRLALPFPRKGKRTTHPGKRGPSENDLEKYRTKWLSALKEYDGEHVHELLTKPNLRSVYIWLAKNDNEWLKEHRPPPKEWKKHLSPLSPRIDWESRDEQLAEKVKASALRLKCAPGRPVQVSIAAIGNDIGELTLLQKRLHKLPLTAKVLAEVAETHEDCGIRRIWWAAELYQQEDICPTRYQLIRRADMRDMMESCKVNEALAMALHAFSNGGELQKKKITKYPGHV